MHSLVTDRLGSSVHSLAAAAADDDAVDADADVRGWQTQLSLAQLTAGKTTTWTLPLLGSQADVQAESSRRSVLSAAPELAAARAQPLFVNTTWQFRYQ